MIAPDPDFIGQDLHQPPTPHLNWRRPAMRRVAQLPELAAEIFADRLHAEANAEDRQFFLQRSPYRFGDAEILRPAGTWRQDQKVPALLLQHLKRVNVPDNSDVGADLAEIIRQHVDKAVVVIDQER